MGFIKYAADENHYKEVLSIVGKANQTAWIGVPFNRGRWDSPNQQIRYKILCRL